MNNDTTKASSSGSDANMDVIRDLQTTIFMTDSADALSFSAQCSEHLPTYIGEKRTITSIYDDEV